jgi:hypothetical protein
MRDVRGVARGGCGVERVPVRLEGVSCDAEQISLPVGCTYEVIRSDTGAAHESAAEAA